MLINRSLVTKLSKVIRFFDICFSFVAIIFLLPFFLLLFLVIKIDSKGPAFYRQLRVGKGGVDFTLYKFRTMHLNADRKGLLTVGGRDPRITRFGYLLRKYKIDELPQLFNVLIGDMSLVGPRPEVRRYVALYTNEQKKVLQVKPGITDEASIVYKHENEILSASTNPEETYIQIIMPHKILLNMKYINNPSVANYMFITLKTIRQIVKQ